MAKESKTHEYARSKVADEEKARSDKRGNRDITKGVELASKHDVKQSGADAAIAENWRAEAASKKGGKKKGKRKPARKSSGR